MRKKNRKEKKKKRKKKSNIKEIKKRNIKEKKKKKENKKENKENIKKNSHSGIIPNRIDSNNIWGFPNARTVGKKNRNNPNERVIPKFCFFKKN